MFHAGNIQGITKYILLSALALSSKCFAAVNRDDNIYNFTSRRPNVGEQFTVPTHAPLFSDSSDIVDETDKIIFFVVCTVSAVFIGILICILKRSKTNSSTSTTSNFPRVAGAVVHPPPRRLVSPTTPVVSYFNSGFQTDATVTVDGLPSDRPPDYATVTIGDLTTQDKSRFPMVMPKLETPPPNYAVGHPFS